MDPVVKVRFLSFWASSECSSTGRARDSSLPAFSSHYLRRAKDKRLSRCPHKAEEWVRLPLAPPEKQKSWDGVGRGILRSSMVEQFPVKESVPVRIRPNSPRGEWFPLSVNSSHDEIGGNVYGRCCSHQQPVELGNPPARRAVFIPPVSSGRRQSQLAPPLTMWCVPDPATDEQYELRPRDETRSSRPEVAGDPLWPIRDEKCNKEYRGPHHTCSACGYCSCNHMGRGECP